MALAIGHFVPITAKGVVGQETDDVFGRKELVANGHFTAIARLVGSIAYGTTLFDGIVVLVNPADGFVFLPKVEGFACLRIL